MDARRNIRYTTYCISPVVVDTTWGDCINYMYLDLRIELYCSLGSACEIWSNEQAVYGRFIV
jgi:hypothetical protein